MASGSIPVVLVPRYFRDKVLIDGGSVWNINIDAAINKCLDMGYESKDIIIDAAACSYHTPNAQEASRSALDNFMGARDIRSYYIGMDAIQAEIRSHNDVEYRFYFQEHHTGCKGGIGGLDFRNTTTWCLQEAGRRDAKTMLGLGQENIRKTLDEWYDNKETIQKDYPNFRDYLNYIWNLV